LSIAEQQVQKRKPNRCFGQIQSRGNEVTYLLSIRKILIPKLFNTTNQLDQFRATNQKRVQKDKDDFNVQFDDGLNGKLHSIKHDPNIFTKQRSMAVDSAELVRGSFKPTVQPPTISAGGTISDTVPLPPITRISDDDTTSTLEK
jgi:hypothetical protein